VAQQSLNHNILRLVVGLVLVTTVIILANVWTATNNQAQQQLNRDLDVGVSVLEEILASREDQLINSSLVLTADFGFKQAVATQDRATIDSVLQNHGQRIDADLMALISLSGNNITSTPMVLPVEEPFPHQLLIENVLREGGASSYMQVGSDLYQVILLTVDAPSPIAITLLGFRLDRELLTQLKNVTQLELSLQTSGAGSQSLFLSTLPASQQERIINSVGRELTWREVAFGFSDAIVSQEMPLASDHDLSVTILLTEDINRLFNEFSTLQANVAIIALLSVVFALIFAALLARRLTRPLSRLSAVAGHISSGHYDYQIEHESDSKEFTSLATAFRHMQESIKAREERITFQANHDPVTQLYNRHSADRVLEERLHAGDSFQAIGMSILGFRNINDVFGYQNGDFCLREIARRLTSLGGFGARLTGGELLWIPDTELGDEALLTLRQMLEQPVNTGELGMNIQVSLGVIHCPEHAQTAEDLFRRMSILLDAARIQQQILPYDEKLDKQYQRRLTVITELEKVLIENKDELSLHYQPKINLISGKVESVEALLRWHSPILGFVPPDEFIALAEHAGFIGQITEWVISRAIKDISYFQDAEVNLSVSVNLSAQDIINAEILEKITQHLRKQKVDAHHFAIEITESDLLKDPDKAIECLHEYRRHGFEIAIDDFGTGYSSLAYLKSLPVDVLKIDKSFILKLDQQQEDRQIVKSILGLAGSFDLKVVAEGIETVESLNLLHRWGCEWGQGYFVSRPLPIDQLIEWYQDNKNTNWVE